MSIIDEMNNEEKNINLDMKAREYVENEVGTITAEEEAELTRQKRQEEADSRDNDEREDLAELERDNQLER